MAPVKSGPTDWEMEFLGEPLTELSDDHLPTVGEMFRYFYHHRRSLPHNASHRQSAHLAVARCIEIWEKIGIPTALYFNLTRALLRLLKTFKAVPYKREGSFSRRKKELLWRRKLDSVFNVAAHDAMHKCSRKSRKMLQAVERQAEELDGMEKSLSWKRKPDEHGGLVATLVADVDGTTRKRGRKGTGGKAKGKENAEPATKRCKVMLSRVGASADSDDELIEQTNTKPQNVSNQPAEFESGTSSIDVQPDDEDIVPPNLPTTIIKQEIDIEWDENDNRPTYFTNYDEYNNEDYSLEKDSVLSDKLAFHNFIEHDEERFKI